MLYKEKTDKLSVQMDDTFKIFVQRLAFGESETIDESLPPDFLDIHEADLAFHQPVIVKGSAAVADDALVLLLKVETEATMVCAICNRDMQVKISIPDFCHTENLSSIKGSVFNYREALREAILLELPLTAECNGGDCPERNFLAKYLANNGQE